MNLEQLIFELCSVYGVSGSEAPALKAAKKYLEQKAGVSVDNNGNLIAVLGNNAAEKTIILDAHLDRIGFIITDIDDKGFVKVDKLGGVDIRTLQDSVLVSESGLKGTVCCLPPHLSDGSEDKASPIDKTWVDFGMPKEQVEKQLKIGDTLTFSTQPKKLLGDKITAPALDDRCGVAALIRAAELIDTDEYKVVILLSTQEETYGTGAKTAAFSIDADEAVAVDVSFASQPDVAGQYGKIELGKGPMICVSSVLSREMSNKLISVAKEQSIPYQLEPIAGATGTNGDHIAVTKSGVKTAVVSIPQRNMHTPVEVISLSDVENTARLIAAYINCGGEFNG